MKRDYGHLIYEIPKEMASGIIRKIDLLVGVVILLSLIPLMFWWTGYQLDLPFLLIALMFSSFAYVLYRLSLQYNHFGVYEKGISLPKRPIGSILTPPKKDFFVPYEQIVDTKLDSRFPFVLSLKLRDGERIDLSAFDIAEFTKLDLREMRRIHDILYEITNIIPSVKRREGPILIRKDRFEEILKRKYDEIQIHKSSPYPTCLILLGCFLFFLGIVAFVRYHSLFLSLCGLLIGFPLVIGGTLWSVRESEKGRKEILKQWKRAEVGR